MSLKAMLWVLESAPVANHVELAILFALADRAADDGTAAWPAQSWIATRSRCSSRTVIRHLKNLEADGVIRRGDQNLVSHLRPDRRPVVWDINLRLGPDAPRTTGRGDSVSPREEPRGDSVTPRDESTGCHTVHNGVTDGAQRGDTAVSHKPSLTIHEPPGVVTEDGNVTRGVASSSLPSSEIPPVWIADPRRARCAVHAGVEHPPACRGCADARGAAEVARDAAEARKATDAAARRVDIDACALCDPSGLAESPAGLVRCPHDPDALADLIDVQEPLTPTRPAADGTTGQRHTPEALRRWRHRHANRTETLGSERILPAIEHDPDEVPRPRFDGEADRR